MRDAGQWGQEHAVNLLEPLNCNTVNQDTYNLDVGGPAIVNNGLNRDGGITELYETSATLAGANYFYPTSNGFVLGLASDGTVFTTTGSSSTTADLYPSDTLYPASTLYPSGGLTDVYQLGKLNSFNFFKRVAIPTMYLDVKVTSDYKLVGIRYGSTTSLVLDEFDPVTMIVSQTYTATVQTLTTMPAVEIAASNTLTFTTVRDKGGFIYNVGNVVYYCVPGRSINVSTGKNTDTVGQSFTCYYADNTPTVVFSTTYQGASAIWSSPVLAIAWTQRQYSGVDGCMMGDFGTNILAASKTGASDTLTLGVSTASLSIPNFVLTVSSAGAVATSSAYTGGSIVLFSSSAAAEANFLMICGVVTPYGSSGIYKNTLSGNYGTFHTSSYLDSAGTTTAPSGAGYQAYPQLDVVHQMLSLRSAVGVISIIAGNATTLGDSNDAGNIINDFGGGGYEYDILSGNPAPNGSIDGTGALIANGARNYYFHPMSWRGATALTGTTVYKLNNGDFVAVNSTSVPSFSEIQSGVVTVNTLSAWGAIIDVTTQTIYYNFSGYTPAFHMSRQAAASDLLNLKIYNKYSSSIDGGLGYLGAKYSYTARAATTSLYGWTAWDGSSGNLIGDFYTNATTATNVTGANAAHLGSYFFNANVPPGGDSTFQGGGIQMLNAVAVQTQGYYGYYLYPSSGGSNLLPWRVAKVFLLHGTYYAFNNEYVYAVPLTNGSSGVIPQGQAPVAVAYGIGLTYLCVSPTKAYFFSPYDNSLYYFDGGRNLIKFFEANQKPAISQAAYSVRDNALYLLTSSSVITIRDEQTQGAIAGQTAGINAEGLQITENDLPTGWGASSYLKSTSLGLYYITGNTIVTRSYYSGTTLIPMKYRTAHYSPAEWQTMQLQRIGGQFYCASNLTSSITLTFYYIRVDGSDGSISTTITTSTRNSAGYARFSWTPSVSDVIAGSVQLQHLGTEQKLVLMELVMYWKPGAEVIPLTEVTSDA